MKERIIDSIVAVLSFIAALISFLGIEKKSKPVIIAFVTFSILMLILILIIWIFYWRALPKKYKNEDKIKQYLEKIYSIKGNCFIFSQGSLSWLDYGKIKNILEKKCRNRQLTIVVPRKNSKTNVYENIKGNIYTYDELHTESFASWSVINPAGKDGVVAIGYDKNGTHYIKEYTSKDEDIIKIVKMFTDFIESNSEKKRNRNNAKVGKH